MTRNPLLSRRAILAGAATASFVPGLAKAEGYCRPFSPTARICEVGMPIGQILRIRSRTNDQVMRNWCWAACIQLIFQHFRYYVSQQAIVGSVFGGLVDRPLPGRDIAHAVASAWRDRRGRNFYPRARVLIDRQYGIGNPNAGGEAIADLSYGRPLIVGANGHATVVTRMKYTESVYEGIVIRDVLVRDPWPGSPAIRSLSPSEFYNTAFLMRVTIP